MIRSEWPGGLDSCRWPHGSLMAAISVTERRALLAAAFPRRFERGTVFIRVGEPAKEAYVVVSGYVKVMAGNPEGNTALLAIRTAGDMVGEFAVLDGGPRSATVQAAGQVVVAAIPADVLHDFLADHPGTARAVQNGVTAKMRESIRHRADLNGVPVNLRLARVLHKLAGCYGRDDAEGLVLAVPLSQADLAALVGATEQSIRRGLAALREQGVITARYRRLIVKDMFRLQTLVDTGPEPPLHERITR